jgi:hypothetical protein
MVGDIAVIILHMGHLNHVTVQQSFLLNLPLPSQVARSCHNIYHPRKPWVFAPSHSHCIPSFSVLRCRQNAHKQVDTVAAVCAGTWSSDSISSMGSMLLLPVGASEGSSAGAAAGSTRLPFMLSCLDSWTAAGDDRCRCMFGSDVLAGAVLAVLIPPWPCKAAQQQQQQQQRRHANQVSVRELRKDW